MAKKRKVSRPKKSVKVRKSFGQRFRAFHDTFESKKKRISINLLKFGVFFVITLFLYIIISNYILWMIFGILAIISGAISLSLLIVLFALWIAKMKFKKKRR